jgi:hypothetical protein
VLPPRGDEEDGLTLRARRFAASHETGGGTPRRAASSRHRRPGFAPLRHREARSPPGSSLHRPSSRSPPSTAAKRGRCRARPVRSIFVRRCDSSATGVGGGA